MKLYYLLFIPFLLGACKKSSKTETEQSAVQTETESYLISTKNKDASCVYLTQDENMNPIISWVEVDSTSQEKAFYCARFNSDKNQFGKAISIPIPHNTSIHEEGMPKIAVKGDGSLFALYETSEEPKENERWGLGDVQYLQSFDEGKTWTKPKSVAPQDYNANRSSSFSGLSRLSDGEIGIAWLSTATDKSANGRPLKFAKTKGQKGLTPPILIDQQACECCRVALDYYGTKGLIVAYRSLRGDNIRDIALAISTDNGYSFGPPQAFTGDEWQINGCPHNGPSVQASKNTFYVTWFTGKEDREGVQYAELDSLGNLLKRRYVDADSQFIQVDLSSDGEHFLAYNHDYPGADGEINGEIIVERMQQGRHFKKVIRSPRARANYPVLKTTTNGQLIVAWTDEGQVRYTILPSNGINEESSSYFLTDNR